MKTIVIAASSALLLAGCSAKPDHVMTPAEEAAASQAADDAANAANGTPSASERSNYANQCNQAKASSLTQRLLATQVIRGAQVTPDGLIIVVEPPTWRLLALEKQKQTAAIFDCAIAGPGKELSSIHFREDRDGPDLLRLEADELLTLREAGYAQIPDTPSDKRHGRRHGRRPS